MRLIADGSPAAGRRVVATHGLKSHPRTSGLPQARAIAGDV